MLSDAKRRPYRRLASSALVLSLLLSLPACATAPSTAGAQTIPTPEGDPRVGLRAGWTDAETAASNLELIAHRDRPEGFINPANMGDLGVGNTDLAFQGDLAFVGNYNGFQVWDISDPAAPTLRASVVCPGGQGDISVYDNLLFVSVEEPRGRIDCGMQGVPSNVSEERVLGVRIFDISDLDAPRQVGAVQTCRGSHTHTLVTDPSDAQHVYLYVSGTSRVRPGEELQGCSGLAPDEDPNTSYFRIEVIRVPLAAPQNAQVVNMPRIFADEQTGEVAGLWRGGEHGPGTQRTSQTDACHDITVYPEAGVAGGACSGNGILLDIREVANPVRTDEVVDPNFAYWHSATFSNDASKVIFTDEWGGGAAARCRASDRVEWGANAIFTLDQGRLQHRSYYKIPAPQTGTENCVAHNGSLIPVPGRDIMVQAWYQGGVSVFDFTDPDRPFEIAFFDRGPMSADDLVLGGYWSAYWYNGAIYGSEIGRGLDVFQLIPSEHLSQNEIDAAKSVRMDRFNPQMQTRIEWPASAAVARAYIDQLERRGELSAEQIAALRSEVERADSNLEEGVRRSELTRLTGRLQELVEASGAERFAGRR